MDPRSETLLESIPDPFALPDPASWIERSLKQIAELSSSSAGEMEVESISLADITGSGPLERYSNIWWRRCAFAVLVADWACFTNPPDRVDFPRLLFVLHRFPKGFRIWMAKVAEGTWFPVGYTGWYPIEETAFRRLETGEPPLLDRTFVPLKECAPNAAFLYLFNYSIVPALHRTRWSRALLANGSSEEFVGVTARCSRRRNSGARAGCRGLRRWG